MGLTKSKLTIKKYPWLKTMWKLQVFANKMYMKQLSLIEFIFQKVYGFTEHELFFAWANCELFGIDFGGCGAGGANIKGACLVHDMDLFE